MMNLKQRLDARRDQQPAQQQQAPKQEPVQRETPGQAISSSQVKQEQEHKQQFDAFQREHNRPARSEKEFDQWQAKQQQAKQEPKQEQPKMDDRQWEAAMRKEVASPTLKDNKPIELPNREDALDRITNQRQEQAKQMDMDPNVKKRQLTR